MNPNLIDSAVKSLKAVEAELTTLVKAEAIKAGWPKELARTLKVSVRQDDIVIEYPAENAEAIEDLEYGTRQSNPQPVFRLFMKKHGKRVSDNVEAWASKTLEEIGRLL